MRRQRFLKRVRIRNYKSIAKCDVSPGGLTLLAGRNGSGKSNFLDALRLIVEGLQTSLDHAIKSRGGIHEVRRRSTGHPHNFGLQVEMDLSNFRTASYGFEISSQPKGGFVVKTERMEVWRPDGTIEASFHLANGALRSASPLPEDRMPPGAPDRLYLVTASGFAEFRDAYDGLLSMGFYNLSPEQMKEVQVPDAGQLLRRDGSNVASVIARLAEDDPQTKQRITEYLHGIVPDIVDFDRVPLGHRETLEFRQHVQGATHPRRFYAANMSDGTLRTLGVLVAAMQLANRKDRVRLVGIEEPETALHPAAAGALMDSLREAASTTQVLLTTHSPDLLDCFDQELDTLFVAQSNLGSTEIGPADAASVESLKNHLYSAGDLLRMDQLRPDPDQLTRQLELVFD